MIPILLTALAPILGKVLDKIPDKNERAKIEAELAVQLKSQEIEIMKLLMQSDVAQAEINKIEAASLDKFKSYPRPLAMWVAVLGLAWNLVPVIVGQFFVWFGRPAPIVVQLPEFVVSTLLYGLLGLGTMRSWEKKSGKEQ